MRSAFALASLVTLLLLARANASINPCLIALLSCSIAGRSVVMAPALIFSEISASSMMYPRSAQ